MDILNPHIVVSTPWIMKYFGYRYVVRLYYVTEHSNNTTRYAVNHTAMNTLCKTTDEVDSAIERIRSKVHGKHAYVVGASWRYD